MSTAWTQEFRAFITCEDDIDERPAHSSPQQITMGTTHIYRQSYCRCVWSPPCSRKQEWFGWRSDGWSVDNRRAAKECFIALSSFWWSSCLITHLANETDYITISFALISIYLLCFRVKSTPNFKLWCNKCFDHVHIYSTVQKYRVSRI